MMEGKEFVFVIKYGGHWGTRGWIYYQKKFKEAKEAYSFYRKAKLPKEVGLEYNNGFRCSLSDAGMRRYFGAYMEEERISKTIQGNRNCLNCKFLSLYIIDGKLVPACGFVEPHQRLRKLGYCGFWERKTIKLLLTNRCRDTSNRGEDCNTCANAILRRPFVGCELKVKDFTLQDEVICCPCYEFKSIIEEEGIE